MKKTKLAKAIALAIAGAALMAGSVSTASAASTTMYNLSTGGGADNSTNITDPTNGGAGPWALSGATDGWTNAAIGPSVAVTAQALPSGLLAPPVPIIHRSATPAPT